MTKVRKHKKKKEKQMQYKTSLAFLFGCCVCRDSATQDTGSGVIVADYFVYFFFLFVRCFDDDARTSRPHHFGEQLNS